MSEHETKDGKETPSGTVSGRPISNRLLAEYVLSELDEMERLSKLTDKELVLECLNTDAADWPVVAEMMTRLYPEWDMDEVPKTKDVAALKREAEHDALIGNARNARRLRKKAMKRSANAKLSGGPTPNDTGETT